MSTALIQRNYNMTDAEFCMFTSNLGNFSILTFLIIMRYVFYLYLIGLEKDDFFFR